MSTKTTKLRGRPTTFATALLSVLALTACGGGEPEAAAPQPAEQATEAAPTTEAPAESATEAEPTADALSSDEVLDIMGAAWGTTAPNRRVTVCEDVVTNSDQEMMNVTSILVGVEMRDLKDSEDVILGFWEEQCAEQAQVETATASPTMEDIDVDVEIEGSVDEVGSDAWYADTAVMSWWGNLSDEDEANVCAFADEHGVDNAAGALSNSMNKTLVDTETSVDAATFVRWINKKCGPASEESKDSEDWVRDSADAWFTEAAVHSVWTSAAEDGTDMATLCEGADTLGVEYMARSFATDVLEPVWSDDSPPIDIGAVEDTLTELCAS